MISPLFHLEINFTKAHLETFQTEPKQIRKNLSLSEIVKFLPDSSLLQEVVVTGLQRVCTQLGESARHQTATGSGTLHTSTPETSIQPHRARLPWGKSSSAQPHLGQSCVRCLSKRDSRWRAVLHGSTLATKPTQANKRRTANDSVMEEDEASEVRKCFKFPIGKSWRGTESISILLIRHWGCHLVSSSTWQLSLECDKKL